MIILPKEFELKNKADTNRTCPECKIGRLICRQNTENGRFFVGCTEYPSCKHSEAVQIESKDQMTLFNE